MNITVINGTEKHGVTYRLKEMFLTNFRDNANITEYYLPRDCPGFCNGCASCTIRGENTCKDAEYVRRIEKSLLEADFIVMTSPAYVFHTTGAMKAFILMGSIGQSRAGLAKPDHGNRRREYLSRFRNFHLPVLRL